MHARITLLVVLVAIVLALVFTLSPSVALFDSPLPPPDSPLPTPKSPGVPTGFTPTPPVPATPTATAPQGKPRAPGTEPVALTPTPWLPLLSVTGGSLRTRDLHR